MTNPHTSSQFLDVEKIVSSLNLQSFHQVNQTLLQLIREAPEPAFLLSSVIDFIHRVNVKKILKQTLTLSSFEFWLNHCSELSETEHALIRGKICGKYVPRSDYQALFPIGMNKVYSGSHLVVAHRSPDVDTMIASFWGWVDAFAARVGSGLHLWALPGGPPDSPITSIFKEMFGDQIFDLTAQKASTLTLHARDLITEKSDISHLVSPYLTLESNLDEIRHKMGGVEFLTIITEEQEGSLSPLGIVRNTDLQKPILGTVSFRDFCNFEEVKMASYLEVISVMDHHKSSLKTGSVPCIIMGDVQSCNILLAEQAFLINDRYSLGGMTPAEIDQQIKENLTKLSSPRDLRILGRLLQRQHSALTKGSFFIEPQREASEYFTFLQAILDDTDLLSKVSARDVECIAQLLNRLASLKAGREIEIMTFDDIPRNSGFAKAAAQRLLRNPEMYALYKDTFDHKEQDVDRNLHLCGKKELSNLFVDTKEQNGCAYVGQTKIFSSNYPAYERHATEMRSAWLEKAAEISHTHQKIDLHLHMVSTIPSAEEVYKNEVGPYAHLDEMWIWIPSSQAGIDHLISFLNSFQNAVKQFQQKISVELIGPKAKEWESIFKGHFLPVPIKISPEPKKGFNIAILKFPASSLNSRKAMVTPFLPK